MNPENRNIAVMSMIGAAAMALPADSDAFEIEHTSDDMPAERFDETYCERTHAGGRSSSSRLSRRAGKSKKRKLFRA